MDAQAIKHSQVLSMSTHM